MGKHGPAKGHTVGDAHRLEPSGEDSEHRKCLKYLLALKERTIEK